MTTPPARRQRADAQRNYERLMAAADDAFARDGIGASLEKIAKTAGVAIGTVYSHFPTREDLLAHLIAERMTRLTDLGQRLLNREDAAAALFEWLEIFGADAATYQGLSDSVIRTLHDPQSPLFNSCETMRRTCGALLERAQDAQQVRTDTTATGVLAMTAALYGAAAAGDHGTGQFLAVLFDGLRKRP
ncbi:MAG TPA: helix-turn-helix domain-containing protein [Mycobacterium sp.]|nr:helix-turn-helix domain-containing protein [Mycobacterium sp.]